VTPSPGDRADPDGGSTNAEPGREPADAPERVHLAGRALSYIENLNPGDRNGERVSRNYRVVRWVYDHSRMAQNFIGCDRDQSFLLPPDVRDWLPDGHLAWFVLDAVAGMDLSEFGGFSRSSQQ